MSHSRSVGGCDAQLCSVDNTDRLRWRSRNAGPFTLSEGQRVWRPTGLTAPSNSGGGCLALFEVKISSVLSWQVVRICKYASAPFFCNYEVTRGRAVFKVVTWASCYLGNRMLMVGSLRVAPVS